MARWTVTIDDELDKRFREVIVKVKGFKKGALKEALEKAIELWLQKYEKQE